jgi:hypothetical protein
MRSGQFVAFGREMGVPGEFACGERLDSPDIKPDGLTWTVTDLAIKLKNI